MNQSISSEDNEPHHTLGNYNITTEEAREDDNFRVLDLPEDLVENHLTKTFTPRRYAKVCRDIAYFTSRIGKAPQKGMGKDYGSPGSGMRRSKEGALYNLAHRVPLLKRAVELGFINTTNENGFNDSPDKLRFAIEPRGKWFLNHYYDDHVPVRKVKKVKLSRWSAATNVNKIVVDSTKADSIKSVDDWNKQVDKTGMGDINTGLYHISTDPITSAAEDPASESLSTWIDTANMPDQFNIEPLNKDVHIHCDLETFAEEFEQDFTVNLVEFTTDTSGDITVSKTDNRHPIAITEDTGTRVGIKGEYDPFVTSGAKDTIKKVTDADWSSDYQSWYIPPEDVLVGVEAILTETDTDSISSPGHIIADYTEYL